MCPAGGFTYSVLLPAEIFSLCSSLVVVCVTLFCCCCSMVMILVLHKNLFCFFSSFLYSSFHCPFFVHKTRIFPFAVACSNCNLIIAWNTVQQQMEKKSRKIMEKKNKLCHKSRSSYNWKWNWFCWLYVFYYVDV